MKRCSFAAPRHIVGNLPPYTNVSLKMILTNPEGRKESDETIIQTDEDGVIFFFFVDIFERLIKEKKNASYLLWIKRAQVCVCIFRNGAFERLCIFSFTVPGAVPTQSVRATPFEDRILLHWKEPSEPNGIIIQYEVSLFYSCN